MVTWIFFFLLAVDPLALRHVETWQVDYEFGGAYLNAIVDDGGDIIGIFYKDAPFIMNAETMVDLRPGGQGPGDLMEAFGLFLDGPNLIVAERTNIIKTFVKQAGSYEFVNSWKLRIS